MASEHTRYPIKIVLPHAQDTRKPDVNRGPRKVFGEVTDELRASLSSQLDSVSKHFALAFAAKPDLPAVARVTLKDEALAKSHRPSGLLDKKTCPIIGVGSFRQLYISVRPAGIGNLHRRINTDRTKTGIADISTIERIDPYTPEDATIPVGTERLRAKVSAGEQSVRLRLFRHHDVTLDAAVTKGFLDTLSHLGIAPPRTVNYAPSLTVYRVDGLKEDHVVRLAGFVGTQSMGPFAKYRLVPCAPRSISPSTIDRVPGPEDGREYPTVGLIDSGVSLKEPLLQPWVVARHEYVPIARQDNRHGSFVGGLLVHPRRLNHGDIRFPGLSTKIVDVVAVDAASAISEDELLSILEDILRHLPLHRGDILRAELPRGDPDLADGAAFDGGPALLRLALRGLLLLHPRWQASLHRCKLRDMADNRLDIGDKTVSLATHGKSPCSCGVVVPGVGFDGRDDPSRSEKTIYISADDPRIAIADFKHRVAELLKSIQKRDVSCPEGCGKFHECPTCGSEYLCFDDCALEAMIRECGG